MDLILEVGGTDAKLDREIWMRLGADDDGSHHCGWRSAAKDCRRLSRLLMVPVERITTELFCCILWNFVMEFWDILTQKGVLE